MSVLGLDTSTAAARPASCAPTARRSRSSPPAERLAAPARARERADAGSGGGDGARRGRLAATSRRSPSASGRARSPGCASASPRRARLASANGLPLRPVSSLAALAEGIERRCGCRSIDARRGEVFAALYEATASVWAPFAALAEEWSQRVRRGRLHARWRRATGRYDFEGCSRRPASAVAPDDSRVPRGARAARLPPGGRGAGQAARGRSPRLPERARREAASERRARDPPAHLRGPSAGHRDRAARLPDAVVAGDVRARAVEAVRDLPRGARGRRDRRLPGLLALRHASGT